MNPKDWVKARVIDIRDRSHRLPSSIVADANVLYLIHYDFSDLAQAGGKLPNSAKGALLSLVEGASKHGTNLCTSASCLFEFVHVVERTELEIIWLLRTPPDPNSIRIMSTLFSRPNMQRRFATITIPD